MKQTKAIIDRVLNFAISRKLTVFAIGTYFAYNSTLNGEQWINLALMYIGTQGAIDIITQLRNK